MGGGVVSIPLAVRVMEKGLTGRWLSVGHLYTYEISMISTVIYLRLKHSSLTFNCVSLLPFEYMDNF